MTHICHVTSLHSRTDPRIFLKECVCLAKAGYRVSLIVADGKGDETKDGVDIVDAGLRPAGKLRRIFRSSAMIRSTAKGLRADVYHLHDPELLPLGFRLRAGGARVVYDVHENLPLQIYSKTWIPRLLRPIVSGYASMLESRAARKFSGVVTVTDTIAARFGPHAPLLAVVHNYPSLSELGGVEADVTRKSKQVCYVGALTGIRGIRELMAAARHTRYGIVIAGKAVEASLAEDLRRCSGNIRYAGQLNRSEVAALYAESIAGIVTFLPEPNHLEALPTKLFEYMASGIPVIASDFPMWREILLGGECGLVVNPRDPHAIAAAIDRLVENPDLAAKLGRNGRKLVNERYSWEREEKNLLRFYESLRVDE